MNAKLIRPFVGLAALILIVGLACGTVTNPTAQPPNQIQPTKPPASGGNVTSLEDVRKATIQIESQGTFVDPQVGLVLNAAGRGSGFIIDPSGIAVTNNHVVTGSALIKVWVGGESTPRNARILGVSECSDLAVIDIDGDGFPYLTWYNQQPSVGLEVYAAGYPLGEPEFSLTKGIVSKERADGQTDWASLDYVLGHDATINPGNSGGPLVSANGQVVGINYSSRAIYNQYFAIDAKMAKSIVDLLSKGQDIDSIGVNGSAVASEDQSLTGIWVASVKSGSPANKAGVMPGDILYQMEGLVLATDGTMKDYCDILRTHKPSDALSLSVIRYASGELLEGQLNGNKLEVTGTFGGGSSTSGGNTGGTSGEAPDYFTEEFDDLIPNWTYEVKHGDPTKLDLHTDNGMLVFNITGEEVYAYLMYDPYIYKNVRIDVFADNRGKNTNDVMLVCRYSDEGWYEFNISNGGLWTIYMYDTLTGGGYLSLTSGGSTAIRSGRNTNEYTAICNGNELSLYINGREITKFAEKKYNLRDGQVGIGVSAYNVLPIIVEFDWVTISEP